MPSVSTTRPARTPLDLEKLRTRHSLFDVGYLPFAQVGRKYLTVGKRRHLAQKAQPLAGLPQRMKNNLDRLAGLHRVTPPPLVDARQICGTRGLHQPVSWRLAGPERSFHGER